METLSITEDNLFDYEDILPEDVAENIGRDIYGGLVVMGDDETPSAAVVWEINHLEDENKPVTSRLFWMNAQDAPEVEELMSEYDETVRNIMIQKSIIDLPKGDADRFKGVFREEAFNVSEREGSEIVVKIGELSKLDIVRKSKLPPNLFALGTLLSRAFRSGIMNCIFHTKREMLEDLSTLPMDWFDPDLSCYVQTDDKITGFLLVHKLPSGRLRVEFMSAIGPDARVDLMYMVRFSIINAMKKYPDDTEVIVPRRDAAAQKLAEYFFPGKKGEPHIYGERSEDIPALLDDEDRISFL